MPFALGARLGVELQMVSRIIGLFRRRDVEPDCEEVRGLSSDLIDGDLDSAAELRVKSHLEKCGPCNAFVKTLRATVGLLRSSPKRTAPADLKQRIRDNIEREAHR